MSTPQDHPSLASREGGATFVGATRHIGQRACGCHVALKSTEAAEISYCATHGTAPALRAALEEGLAEVTVTLELDLQGFAMPTEPLRQWGERARAALRTATGEAP